MIIYGNLVVEKLKWMNQWNSFANEWIKFSAFQNKLPNEFENLEKDWAVPWKELKRRKKSNSRMHMYVYMCWDLGFEKPSESHLMLLSVNKFSSQKKLSMLVISFKAKGTENDHILYAHCTPTKSGWPRMGEMVVLHLSWCRTICIHKHFCPFPTYLDTTFAIKLPVIALHTILTPEKCIIWTPRTNKQKTYWKLSMLDFGFDRST